MLGARGEIDMVPVTARLRDEFYRGQPFNDRARECRAFLRQNYRIIAVESCDETRRILLGIVMDHDRVIFEAGKACKMAKPIGPIVQYDNFHRYSRFYLSEL